MTREEFWNLYNDKKYDEILPTLLSGETFGFDIKTYTQQASWSEDYEQLYFLWKMKAEEYTPFIQEVFSRFEKGESHEKMTIEKEAEKQRKLDSVKADLTNIKSADQIPFGEITFEKNDDETFRLTLPIFPYLCEGYICENDSIIFSPIKIDKRDLKNGRIDFNENLFDESIYLFHSHNPVDLKSIKFGNYSENYVEITFSIKFLLAFEGNGENQMLQKKITVPNFFK